MTARSQESDALTITIYHKGYKWPAKCRGRLGEVPQGLAHRSFCPCGNRVCHPPGTCMWSPTWKLPEPHHLGAFMGVTLRRYNWLNSSATMIKTPSSGLPRRSGWGWSSWKFQDSDQGVWSFWWWHPARRGLSSHQQKLMSGWNGLNVNNKWYAWKRFKQTERQKKKALICCFILPTSTIVGAGSSWS